MIDHASREATPTMEEILSAATELPALAQVAQRVVDISHESKATSADIERALGMDTALAARVLAMANSAYYGLERQISTLREAVAFIGVKAVRKIAESVTIYSSFLGKSDDLSLARRALWRHSMMTAQCARIITCHLHPTDRDTFEPEEAYTCGLLHDIGQLAIDNCCEDLYLKIIRMAAERHVPFHEAEHAVIPFSHGLVGGALAARWNLPPSVCETIAFHHTPRAAAANPKLTATVSFANNAAHFLAQGRQEDAKSLAWLAECNADAGSPLRLSPDAVSALISACRSELEPGFVPAQRVEV